ncbi:MAG: Fur family transcriptional regulator [Candidatus Methylophosphatis roskildensis]
MSLPPELADLAELARACGVRATPARLHVLGALRDASRALSHHDIEAALSAQPLDRVTLYRVLDWAVAAGLVLRSTDDNRTYRYSLAARHDPHAAHAHFSCDDCGRVFCLDDIAPAPAMPAGFHADRVDLAVHGRCAACSDDAPHHAPRP